MLSSLGGAPSHRTGALWGTLGLLVPGRVRSAARSLVSPRFRRLARFLGGWWSPAFLPQVAASGVPSSQKAGKWFKVSFHDMFLCSAFLDIYIRRKSIRSLSLSVSGVFLSENPKWQPSLPQHRSLGMGLRRWPPQCELQGSRGDTWGACAVGPAGTGAEAGTFPRFTEAFLVRRGPETTRPGCHCP